MVAQEGNAARKLPEAAPVNAAEKVLPTASIGDVLKQLKADFPDVTVSKIRFLESEGLISPRRSQSGYRRFSPEDIQRLRYILTHQRDNYLPLKVIKQQLDAMDEGKVTPVYVKQGIAAAMTPDQLRSSEPRRLTRADLTARASVEDSFTGSLIRMGLINADPSGFFSVDDVAVVQISHRLNEFGLDGRHLKAMMTIAHRQLDLVARVSDPLTHARDENARQRAEETAREVSALVLSLNAAIVKGNLS